MHSKMRPERWKTIEEIFHAALDRPLEDRRQFLETVCGSDPELREEIDSLLHEAAESASFMERPLATLGHKELDSRQPKSLTGRDLNHYQIGTLLGAGGMAEVYRGHDTRLRRDVAIKVLHTTYVFDRERRQRLQREAQALASISHPNIEAVYGFEEADDICALILELIEGETLSERIRRGPVPLPAAVEMCSQMASALEAAHAKGIVHRDLKPSNIKITPQGTVKVLDFGIAKLLPSSVEQRDHAMTLSQGHVVLGTVAYMSPEQARGLTVDVRTDIWAFGCVLYEMLTGAQPFEGETSTDILVKIATQEPDWSRLSDSSGPNSSELQKIIRKCMQKAPDSRFQSVHELVNELDAIAQPSRGRSRALNQSQELPQTQFVLPAKLVKPLFLFAQFGYLALYGAAMHYIESIGEILSSDFRLSGDVGVVATMILAMCGVAVRLYLISAVGLAHPAAGQKFQTLFPTLLILDGIWAASPLLLWRRLGYGIAFTCVAFMAYVPFAQRTLLRSIYSTTPATGLSRFFETK